MYTKSKHNKANYFKYISLRKEMYNLIILNKSFTKRDIKVSIILNK